MKQLVSDGVVVVPHSIGGGGGRKRKNKIKIICLHCNKEFEVLPSQIKFRNRKFCGVTCRIEYYRVSNEFENYRNQCSFGFNVWDYPEEFDLGLIYKYGWYKAANHGNNMSGVSRDHKISIVYGWENRIPPEVISHPANCKLMRHPANVSKGKKCSIVLDELLLDIKEWNEKYKNLGC